MFSQKSEEKILPLMLVFKLLTLETSQKKVVMGTSSQRQLEN